MKTSLLLPLPLIALFFAGCSKNHDANDTTPAHSPTLSERADSAAEKTKDAAVDAKDAVAAKLTEWKLTPSDIKSDLEKSGRVVREKTLAAGEKVGGALDNARIVTVINGKFVADSNLSALKINVDADNGIVTLTGEVATLDLVGRAVAVALNTDGVSQVIALLKVESAEVVVPAADKM
ncbi:BON domain-containing protein [Rariglobus hedericola]|uniref:BON domain-containing protein n=1 Tax=Rariglobus hedericola TaxID=2597822 RepID=A0A556QRS6_9BACT|nr:BON domain-containing protein [Rariglobus hedericola]TSJ79345.1 BON domain-containing protein [Rariglobus hedericola]